MHGRVASYIHSDSSSPNKGGCLILVETDTDFATRTPELAAFADKVAKLAYGASANTKNPTWTNVIEMFPALEEERMALSQMLREKVLITKILSIVA
jgi:translation elongation factor EF-Ts